MLNLAIIIGSTRPNRVGASVGEWVYEQSQKREGANYELIDLKDYNLPLLDETSPPSMGNYQKEHTKKWSDKIKAFDGYVFVTPEYNHSTSGALKNALDFLYSEWNNKAASFVGYGGTGGLRGIEHLRLIAAELQMATIRNQVSFSLREDFESYKTFSPREHHTKVVDQMFRQLELWAKALKGIRTQDSS